MKDHRPDSERADACEARESVILEDMAKLRADLEQVTASRDALLTAVRRAFAVLDNASSQKTTPK